MLNISRLEEIQSLIERKTINNHKDDLVMCQSGINLLFEAFTLLENTEFPAGKDKDYRFVIWGYLGTITSTLLWCFNAASKGQYRIAMILVRVLIEEAVTSKFFLKYPEKAFETIKQAAQDSTPRVRFEPNIYQKFKAVGIGPNNSLYKFYGQVSERFSHSNSTVLPINIDNKHGGVRVQEPDYNPERFQAITVYIIQICYIMIGTVGQAFGELQGLSPTWAGKSKSFLDSVIERRTTHSE